MTHEEVAILWKDANGWDVRGYTNTLEDLERFANLVATKEREACAKVCEEHPDGLNMLGGAYIACAKAIRARGEQA
jgi:hypothetical protein